MKTLNDNYLINKFPEIFTDEMNKHIQSEKFKWDSNDSYCYREYQENHPDIHWIYNAYYKHIDGQYPINVYIFENGIGVDIDYDCGGNLHNHMWNFESYTFEEAYDNMVDYVNDYK